MDINQCINHLGLNRSTYRLTQSNPPHEFIVWDGPDPQPTQEELQVAWVEIQNAHDAQEYARKRREAYDAAGCTIDALAIATFESVFADDSSAAVQLQIEREKIRAAIPKAAT